LPSLPHQSIFTHENYCPEQKAFHDYEIVEKVVAGISLTGSEVKSAARATTLAQLCIVFERRNVH